jgi:glutamyl-tRNA reductase
VIVSNRTLSRAWEVVSNLLEPKEINGSRLDEFEAETENLSQEFQCPALLRLLHKRGESPGRAVCPSPPREPATEAIELGQIPDVIAEVDLVICSTASPDLVLRHEELKGILHHSSRSLFIIDIAIPRDVDPKLGSLPNVYLYNLDDLDRLVAQNIDSRRQEIPRAEAIVKDEVQEFTKWLNSLQVAPTIKLLQHRFGTLQEAEIKRYGKKFCSHDREQLQKFTEGLCSKMLHQPIAFLRRLTEDAATGDQLAAIDIIRRMFDLDYPEDDS